MTLFFPLVLVSACRFSGWPPLSNTGGNFTQSRFNYLIINSLFVRYVANQNVLLKAFGEVGAERSAKRHQPRLERFRIFVLELIHAARREPGITDDSSNFGLSVSV